LILKKAIFQSQFPPSTLREIERVNNERARQHQTRVARYIKTRFLADVAAASTLTNENNDEKLNAAAGWVQQLQVARGNHSLSNHSLSAV
jgi:predicted nucleotidyltransferase